MTCVDLIAFGGREAYFSCYKSHGTITESVCFFLESFDVHSNVVTKHLGTYSMGVTKQKLLQLDFMRNSAKL